MTEIPAAQSTHDLHIIPQPLRATATGGSYFLAPEDAITFTGPGSEDLALLLAEYLRPATGYAFSLVSSEAPAASGIHVVTRANPLPDDAGFQEEDYTCRVSETGVVLDAKTPAGLARAIQTFRQLLPERIFSQSVEPGAWPVPCLLIEDRPRFRWRGMHLDVARHFFSVEAVCRFIDLIALHRFNICHLHLTDDQGWRLEIKKYPKLTEVGAWRKETLVGHELDRPRRYDGQPYGGFFSQEEMKTIIAFAARRQVTIVPEIEMPGHAQEVIAAYPELGCESSQTEVRCHWGISQKVLNVEDATLAFFKDVLDEVIALFPSKFIHIGGDEAPKFEWSESPTVQSRMAERGISNENELQSWFIRQMLEHLAARGRRLIGWDEILEGGLPEGASVMSWQGEEGGLKAAEAGHDVVMAPCQWVYFDHHQAEPVREEPLGFFGTITTEHVYAYEPVPPSFPEACISHIMGAQGQLWSEYIPSVEHLDYMAFPRACALAEVLWLPKEELKYSRFLSDLPHHRCRLAELGVNPHPRP
ncbi:MAG: beta-N-acetylhexosaminidase [Terrimicrobiaceae bacterium]